ncbi:hypothetical protein L1049_000402 [Liquidambar formosana]|uniref:Scarecrow-like protein 18 n=1 Tax=Liquidambar formosana TaxID=63359 RepID=A0AAP0N8X5_LIQFO
MLGSFSSSHEEEEDASDLHLQIPQPSRGFASPAIRMRQLVISCAELVSQSDFSSARRLVSILSANASPYGDSTERLVHQFARALSLRLNRYAPTATTRASVASGGPLMIPADSTSTAPAPMPSANESESEALQSAYLALNQITPFIRFSQLTANQAILEAIEGKRAIHIVDLDIMHGVQWPPLMQAIAERSRSDSLHHPPPMLRITGTGQDLDLLQRTGDRLLKFAQSLGLRFQFHPLVLLFNDQSATSVATLYNLPSALAILPDETLAVNCVLYLHRLLKDDSRDLLRLFLHKIKAMNPKVVTVAEREAHHNHPLFLQRFVEALDHYTAVFDSLEATLPPNSRERLAVEQIWFGREIADIVAAEGDDRRERHERFESWEVMLRTSGFSNVPLSPFALSQARLLLRLHYPSEGYHLHILNNSFFLGWQNRPLFSVSSWH